MKAVPLPEWVPALRGWAQRQPKLFLVAGGAALLLLGWALYVPPIAAIRRASIRWSGLKEETAETRRLLDLVREGKLRTLPAQQELPGLLEGLHTRARECGVNLQEISPGRADFTDPARPAFLAVQMRLEGSYRAIGEFLGKLRDEPSFGVVSVRSLRIGREEQLLPKLRVQLSVEIALRKGQPNGT